MKLDLRFTARPMEELWCRTVAALVFQDSIRKANGISGLNAKTSGYIEHLSEKGFWKGAAGDTLLVASQGMIKAKKILLVGLGAYSDYSIELFMKTIEKISLTLDKMGDNDIGIQIPALTGIDSEYPSLLEAACKDFVNIFFVRHKAEPDFLLKIIFSVSAEYIAALETTVQYLKKHFVSQLDDTIILAEQSVLKPAGMI